MCEFEDNGICVNDDINAGEECFFPKNKREYECPGYLEVN